VSLPPSNVLSAFLNGHASKRFDIPAETVLALFKDDSIKAYQTGQSSPETFWGDFLKLGIAESIENLQAQFISYNTPDAEMLELINWLTEKGYRLGTISNTIPELTQDVEARFSSVFDVLVLSDRKEYDKDDGRLYEIALQKISQPPEQCIYIDDRAENLTYLKSKGVVCIHYTGFQKLIAELTKYLPECRESLLKVFSSNRFSQP